MSKTPIDLMLDGVAWATAPKQDEAASSAGLPYATHSGVLDLMGHKLRCYRLNDGRAIFDADDINAFFRAGVEMDGLPGGTTSILHTPKE